MRRELLTLGVLAGVGLSGPAPITAQGFAVYEHGTCQMGRAGAGVAAPCADGSAMMFNPAGLTAIDGVLLTAGVTLIDARGSFTDDLTRNSWNLANDPVPVPHLYAAYGADKLSLGLGVFVPYGLGTRWPLDTTLTAVELAATGAFPGRFNGYDNDLRSIYVQPTVAYRITPKISVGAGFDFVIGAIELNQRADLSGAELAPGVTAGQLGIPFRTDFAKVELNATGATGFGGHIGVIVDVTDQLSFGARYLSQVTLNYVGDATFNPVPTGITLPAGNPFGAPAGTPLDAVLATLNLFGADGPLADQTAKASITMPAQLVAGVAFDVSSALTLLADYQFTGWSVFDTLKADFEKDATPDLSLVENYRDTHAFRGAFEYRASDAFTLRGGYLYHTAAAPPETVTPLLPEGQRNEFTVGLGYRLGPSLWANLAYQYIRQDKRRGRVTEVPPGTSPDVVVNDINSGLYDFFAHLAGLTFTVTF